MVDLVGRYRMLERNRGWDEHFAAQEQEAHQSWQRNEERRRYDEQTRLARAESERQSQFYNTNAGLFDESALSDMSPRNAPQVQPTAATPSGPTNLTVGGAAPVATTTPNAGVTQPNVQQVGALDDASLGIVDTPTPLEFVTNNPSQRTALATYRNQFERTINGRTGSLQPLARALDTMVRTGLIDQAVANRELSRAARYAGITDQQRDVTINVGQGYTNQVNQSVRDANPGIDFSGTEWAGPEGSQIAQNTTGPGLAATGVRVNTQGAVGLATEVPSTDEDADAYFQGINDTSRPLRATREMRLARANIQNNLARAQLYAQHGRPDMAAEAFAQSLQGQADYITMERMVLYRAAANGSNRAMERLMEEYNGYPQGSVRVRTTGERNSRFLFEIQNEDGTWVPGTSAPLTRDQALGGLLNLVDAEGAAARSEANRELLQTSMEVQGRYAIAGIEAQTALARMATDVQIAQMNNEARAALASGDATVVQNQETGEISVFYPRYSNGQMYMEVERISTERQRSPDSNSRREIDVPVRTRITGNVGAN